MCHNARAQESIMQIFKENLIYKMSEHYGLIRVVQSKFIYVRGKVCFALLNAWFYLNVCRRDV